MGNASGGVVSIEGTSHSPLVDACGRRLEKMKRQASCSEEPPRLPVDKMALLGLGNLVEFARLPLYMLARAALGAGGI